ncbi:MAG: RsmB/NOP family class I SAM-dependent RNA methyltransferase [Myxococcota bacterium]
MNQGRKPKMRGAQDARPGGAPLRGTGGDPRGAHSGRLGRIQDRLVDAATLVLGGTPVDRALDEIYTRARDLGSSERAQINGAIYDLVRNRRRLEDLLARAAKAQKKKLETLEAPIRARLMLLALLVDRGQAAEVVEASDPYAAKRIQGLVPALISARAKIVERLDTKERIAIEASLPDWFAGRLIADFGEARAYEIAMALLERAPLSLRVNRLKSSRDQALAQIQKAHDPKAVAGQLSPDAILLSEHRSITGWTEVEEGLVEVQDEGSQLLALATGAQAGMVVYDACAGAGGKTLALAAMMENRGRLVAFDREATKLSELMRRARRAGITTHESHEQDFVTLPQSFLARADVVLVDAPCSGTGTLRRQPDARGRLTEEDVGAFTPWQGSLLSRAVDATRPGGFVVYATCSLLKSEGEDIVGRVLSQDSRLEPAPLAEVFGEALSARLSATYQARIGPGPTALDPDGFYVARLRRKP